MQAVIIGGNGLLGSDMVKAARRRGWEWLAPTSDELDIADDRSITAYFLHTSPDWIINCAAYTAVDDAETHRDDAFLINGYGPNWLARVSNWTKARVLHVSTDFVFDGAKRTPYTEEDNPNPLNVYGQSKLQGEIALREASETAVIVRSAWLFGVHGDCFLSKVIRIAKDGKPLRVVNDQTGSPTYTNDLAAAIVHLIERSPEAGVYNIVNSGTANWHQLAVAGLAAAGIRVEVTPISSAEWQTAAKRPEYSVLSTEKYESLGLSPLPNWQDAVRRFVRELSESEAVRE